MLKINFHIAMGLPITLKEIHISFAQSGCIGQDDSLAFFNLMLDNHHHLRTKLSEPPSHCGRGSENLVPNMF